MKQKFTNLQIDSSFSVYNQMNFHSDALNSPFNVILERYDTKQIIAKCWGGGGDIEPKAFWSSDQLC